MQTRKRAAAEGSLRLAGAERTALAVLAAGALVIPAIITSGSDPFRFPKELAFRAEAILLLAAAVFWMTSWKRTLRIGRGPELVAVAAIVAWTLLTTATSTNRLLSADSLITVAAAAVIFIVTCVAAQALSLLAVDVLMVGACANAALVILQETKLWAPLALTIQGHYASVGLLGNANDVGTFLVAPAIAAVVVAVTAPGARRWIYALIALLLSGGVVASGTRAALGALVAGLIVFALLQARRRQLQRKLREADHERRHGERPPHRARERRLRRCRCRAPARSDPRGDTDRAEEKHVSRHPRLARDLQVIVVHLGPILRPPLRPRGRVMRRQRDAVGHVVVPEAARPDAEQRMVGREPRGRSPRAEPRRDVLLRDL